MATAIAIENDDLREEVPKNANITENLITRFSSHFSGRELDFREVFGVFENAFLELRNVWFLDVSFK